MCEYEGEMLMVSTLSYRGQNCNVNPIQLENLAAMMTEDETRLMLFVSIITFIVTILIYFIWSRRRHARRSVLLTGLSDSGKTLIFARLLLSHFVHTHTSIKENIGDYATDKDILQVVDVPGHERVRSQLFDKHKGFARGIVFILDSVTLQKDVRDVAEYLFNILSDSVILKNNPHILILCNKQDQPLAKSSQIIKSLLEKEINIVRKTKSSQLQSVDPNQSNNSTYIGKKGKDFEFSHMNMDIEIVECSAIDESSSKPANINYVTKWLNKIA